jgi:hypothetical protein
MKQLRQRQKGMRQGEEALTFDDMVDDMVDDMKKAKSPRKKSPRKVPAGSKK